MVHIKENVKFEWAWTHSTPTPPTVHTVFKFINNISRIYGCIDHWETND